LVNLGGRLASGFGDRLPAGLQDSQARMFWVKQTFGTGSGTKA